MFCTFPESGSPPPRRERRMAGPNGASLAQRVRLFRLRSEWNRRSDEVSRVRIGFRHQLLGAPQHVIGGVDVPFRIEGELVQFAETARYGSACVPREQPMSLGVVLQHFGSHIV